MSRKFDRTFQVNKKALAIIEDPMTLVYLGKKVFRPRPKYLPKFIWKALLSFVMTPSAKENNIQLPK